jgi:penicillin amidase
MQMDLLRRQGEGHLAEILGSGALSSDRCQVMLGLDRAAQRDWQALAVNPPARQVLQAFTDGVNAWINAAAQSNSLPFLFKLLNYQPRPWTPGDTLVIQGVMTQDLAFSTTPLHYALLTRALDYDRTMQWFPCSQATSSTSMTRALFSNPRDQRRFPHSWRSARLPGNR